MPKNIAKQVDNAIARDRDTIEQEKNTQLRIAAQTFLSVVMREDTIITSIQTKLATKQEEIRISKKLQNLIKSAHNSAIGQLKNRITTVNLKQLQQEWDTALHRIYEAVHAFQQRIFEIEGTQSLAYVTVESKTDKSGQTYHKVFTFEPKTGISSAASSRGGARKAIVRFGRQTNAEKDESFNAMIRALGGDDADTTEDGEIKASYQRLSNTYTEVLFRYSRALRNNKDKGNAVWWFTDSSHSTLAGAMEVFSKGDLAEAFVSFIPSLIENPGKVPPYSGTMDPTDVGAFMTQGVSEVDSTKGRLVGDVFHAGRDGHIYNWAVKAKGAQQMGYKQMISLANQILVSPNPLATISEIRAQDIAQGGKRNRALTEGELNALSGSAQEAMNTAVTTVTEKEIPAKLKGR